MAGRVMDKKHFDESPTISSTLTYAHGPCDRRKYHSVSSGMLPYQISMYWLNAMYAQNTTNPNVYLPRSW